VRSALACAAADETVGDVAMRHGFTHLGRFSVEYRRRFGEAPSATLARRRA
jgi:AraC-like DNA-binding protein